MHAIVRKLQELKLRYWVISYLSYLSYHSFNILDDLPKSDISYFLSITVPSAVRSRRPHLHFTESLSEEAKLGKHELLNYINKILYYVKS